MIIDRETETYLLELKNYVDEYKNVEANNFYTKIKQGMWLLGYTEVSFNNSKINNINIYTIKFHKFNINFRDNCIEYIINITLFDNCDVEELSLSVNYTEVTTTQKTLF